ncbi:MAG TPA: uracil-DNA glycosylase [Candidatus Sumerlaeota bacterium]|nr:uracil-DNA glycosylase [Candidatus Sumerlaeota bacterium]
MMPPLQSISREWKSGTPAPGWREVLRQEFAQEYMKSLVRFLDEERVHHTIFPEPANIFRAYSMMDYDDVSVVILGQDPYHGPGQANGLCFSVNEGIPLPPSLQNIYKEIESDTGHAPSRSGNLDRWARQGVFLLNTCLTVRRGEANSHRGRGWERFTAKTIEALSAREAPMVFLLWGRNAQEQEALIAESRHLVLKAAHPSPFSADRGFFGCRHFSKANAFLTAHGRKPIEW